ncbi:Oligosaccharide translocation protein rft1 [Scheffersomyces spartinae]|uniref:Man(5)GlcNAc(2)-PP-dolichol translocation protein RFT1 n=1 Tax=Scheffersomyces spartinae TaxID=45513 RepID=A0A9P8AJK3_9ASCO|nr:Oligosaccharide translocation protein rft1 [Scheffersomyces spartinae]KAG7194969.1 Oligosaccharide translocation protein rft1 [Scheffersomyces spartinae]
MVGIKDGARKSTSGLSLAAKSSAGVSWLMMVQVVSKLLTFVLNQLLIRFISPKVFGVSAYLEFIVNVILFFSREAVRLAIQRVKLSDKKNDVEEATTAAITGYSDLTETGLLQSIINFGYVPLAIGVPFSLVVVWYQLKSATFLNSVRTLPNHEFSMAMIWISIMLELIVEPVYLVNQYQLNLAKRSKVEGMAVLFRCLVTFFIIFGVSRWTNLYQTQLQFEGYTVLAFASGQFAYSFTLFLLYNLDFQKSYPNNTRMIQPISSKGGNSVYWLNPSVLAIWKSLVAQMFLKQILTEGDKLLINYLCTVEEQGVYSVVSNYGSIIARLLFQPVEEYVRLFFTRLLAVKLKSNLDEASRTLTYIGIFYANLSSIILLAGVPNGPYILGFLLGRKGGWSNTNLFEVFQQYIIYIPFMAFNGVLEAFFSCVASKSELVNFSKFLTGQTLAVFVTMYVLIGRMDLGISGFILSNCFNMLLRIAYCSNFIIKFFRGYGYSITLLLAIARFKNTFLITAIAFAIEYKLIIGGPTTSTFRQLASNVVVCLFALLLCLIAERNLLLALYRARIGKRV